MKDSLTVRDYVDLLGKSWSDSRTAVTLRQISNEIEIDQSEYLAHWDCLSKGIAIVLNDALYIQSHGKQFLKNGPLIVVAIQFFSDGYEGHCAYTGELPGQVQFGDSRLAIKNKFGSPSKSGGGTHSFGRTWPYWDRYDYPAYSVAFQYDLKSRVDMVDLIWSESETIKSNP